MINRNSFGLFRFSTRPFRILESDEENVKFDVRSNMFVYGNSYGHSSFNLRPLNAIDLQSYWEKVLDFPILKQLESENPIPDMVKKFNMLPAALEKGEHLQMLIKRYIDNFEGDVRIFCEMFYVKGYSVGECKKYYKDHFDEDLKEKAIAEYKKTILEALVKLVSQGN